MQRCPWWRANLIELATLSRPKVCLVLFPHEASLIFPLARQQAAGKRWGEKWVHYSTRQGGGDKILGDCFVLGVVFVRGFVLFLRG